jgi:DNA-binding response OmpR family regulator
MGIVTSLAGEWLMACTRKAQPISMLRFLRKKKSILLLDDDLSIQRLVAALLRREGFHVDMFPSGRQALEAMSKRKYDAFLLDLMMPVEGGMTVIRHLREKNPVLLQRVLLFTASPDSMVASLAPDVAGVVPKPFQDTDLVRAVRAVAG